MAGIPFLTMLFRDTTPDGEVDSRVALAREIWSRFYRGNRGDKSYEGFVQNLNVDQFTATTDRSCFRRFFPFRIMKVYRCNYWVSCPKLATFFCYVLD